MLSAGLILFLAALQGVTELFPVSSLGHAVVVPRLIGLNFNETRPAFVPVLALLHLGTAGSAALPVPPRLGADHRRVLPRRGARAHRRSRSAPGDHAGGRHRPHRDHRVPAPGSPEVAVRRSASRVGVPHRQRRDPLRGRDVPAPRRAPPRASASAPVLAHEEDDPAYQRIEGLSLRTALIVGILPGGRAPPGDLAFGDHHGRRARGRPPPRGGGTIRVPARHPDHPRGGAARGAHARCRRADPGGGHRRGRPVPGWSPTPAPVSCFVTFASDVWTPSRITVPLSGPRASSSSTDGRELIC